MAKLTPKLTGMTVEGLMDLRRQVDETLHKRRAELQQQLAALYQAAEWLTL